ncbi:hypothetical protein ABES25_09975 [Bacillus gobiensis]|uniref:phage tail assembly chaperone G n=1 Tax=Bacillus gobiensis TaxID=1441095 RepID=UPI003D23E866
MKTMKTKLFINGEEKTFTAPSFINVKMHKRAVELMLELNVDNPTPDELDTLIDFIVEVYGKQFTSEEFEEGFDGRQLNDKIAETLYGARGMDWAEIKKAYEKMAKENANEDKKEKN